MIDLEKLSLTVRDFKCFIADQGFNGIRLMNLIIGRNNSGKSTLLDLLEYAVTGKIEQLGDQGRPQTVSLSYPIESGMIDRAYQTESTEKQWATQHAIGRNLQWIVNSNGQHVDPRIEGFKPPYSDVRLSVCRELLKTIATPFTPYIFKRILADRDIVPEEDKGTEELKANGQNATSAFQRFVNREHRDRSLIERRVLDDLNYIFWSDAKFTRLIPMQKQNSNHWEICFEEEKKGIVPLSRTGSGFKTVLLVLLNIYVWPVLSGKTLDKFIFGFEELENNLHPAIQRRLFQYLRRKTDSEKCRIVVTTQSPVVIDLFSQDSQTQILRVNHDGEKATVEPVENHLHGRSVVTDLGARASDLLQSNVVVWVEGPSDRLYFNRWIDV